MQFAKPVIVLFLPAFGQCNGCKSAPCSTSAAASGLTPIKMVYAQNAAVQEPIFVAKDAGFWAKNGLDVEMTNVTGTAQVPAITSGQAQFANTGAAEVTSALLNGAPIVMIGTLSDLPIFDLATGQIIFGIIVIGIIGLISDFAFKWANRRLFPWSLA